MSSLVKAIELLEPQDHPCLIFRRNEDELSTAAVFLGVGLARHEKCLYLGDPEDTAELWEMLRRSCPLTDEALHSGQLAFLDANQQGAPEGRFEPERLVEFCRTEALRARSEGYSRLRMSSGTRRSVLGAIEPVQFFRFEQSVGVVLQETDTIVLRRYPRYGFPVALMSDLMRMYPVIITEGRVCRNAFYVPPDEWLSPERSEHELDRLLASMCNSQDAEERMRDQMQQREVILRTALDGFLRLDIESGRFVEANDAMVEMLGRPREEIFSMEPAELVSGKTRSEVTARIGDIIRTGALRFETQYLHKDGHTVDCAFSARYSEDSGRPLLFSFCRDISHQKQMEEALRESERRFREILEHVDLVAMMLDKEGRTAFCNDHLLRLTGWERSEVLDRSWFEVFAPEDVRKPVMSSFVRHMETGEPFPPGVETELLTRSGERRLIAWSNAILRSREGEIIGAAGIGADITERRQTEQALRESEERFRELAELLPEIVYEIDLEGNLLFANRHAFEMMGYAPEELQQGINIIACLVPEDRERAGKNIRRVLQGEPMANEEYRVVRRDGSIFPAMSRSSLLVRDGRITGLRGILIDITERKHWEEQIVRARDFYLTLFENSPTLIWRADPQGRSNYVNSTWSAFTGLSMKATMDHGWQKVVHPDDLPRCMKEYEAAYADRRPYQSEYRMRRHDGEYRWFIDMGQPFNDLDGQFAGFIGSCYDITERKQAEEALRATNELLDALVRTTPVSIDVVDTEGIVRLWNQGAERIFGWTAEEAVGKHLPVIPPEAEEEFLRLRDKVMGGEAFSGLETRRMRKDGTVFDANVSVSPLRDAEGRVVAFTGIVLDITEQKRTERERLELEAKIQHTQKLESLGVLAGGIAHDFNNLLTGILGYASLAVQDLSSSSPAHDSVKQIEIAARRAADLTKQLLAYSGKGRFVTERVNLKDVVQEMAHLLEVSISKKHVLVFEFASNLPAVQADVTQLRQIIMNLIINASEAIGERAGTITVRASALDCDREYLASTYVDEDLPPGRYVSLEVGDTGCGMSDETRARVFEPFFTTKFMGRGLGLAAVLGIVRGHRGAIRVYSVPGRGTSFRILLPATSEAAAMRGTAADQSAVPWRGQGLILVVDDEPSVQALAKRVLERAGYDVLVAADGQEAVELYADHKHNVHAVLLDVTMPRMDGEEAFRELRRMRPDVRVVLSSGFSENEAMLRFEGKGLAGFVQKPYVADELVTAIRKAVDS